jgi:hypothetical protein
MYLYQEQEITLAHYNTTNHVFTFSLYSFIFRKLLCMNNNGWKTNCIQVVSEGLLFNANSAIVQLYHSESKLIFNEMMMRSTLF